MSQNAIEIDILDLVGPDRIDRASEFVRCWLYENLSPFHVSPNVVALAAQLKRDAAQAGIDLGAIERSRPLAVERLVLEALDRRVASA